MDKEMIKLSVNSIISSDAGVIGKLSNITAAIKQYSRDINWVGFYFFDFKSQKLYLGPFQGKIACPVIDIKNGVCGKSARDKKTIVVDDVHSFEGHIACDFDSKSEIVIPIMKNNQLLAVLDVDSPVISRFSQNEREILEEVAQKISQLDISSIGF